MAYKQNIATPHCLLSAAAMVRSLSWIATPLDLVGSVAFVYVPLLRYCFPD